MPTLFWIAIVALLGIAYLVRVHRMRGLQKEMDQMAAVNKALEDRNYMLEMQVSNMNISMKEQKSTLTKLKEMVEALKPKPKEEENQVETQVVAGKRKPVSVSQTPTASQATSSSHRSDRVTDNNIYVTDPMSPLNPLSPTYQAPHTMRDDTEVHSSHRHDDTSSYSSSVCSNDYSTTGSSGYDSSPSYDSGSSSDSGSYSGGCY